MSIRRPSDVDPLEWKRFKSMLYRRKLTILKLVPSKGFYGIVVEHGKVPFFDIRRVQGRS
jgi:hypothetical protein